MRWLKIVLPALLLAALVLGGIGYMRWRTAQRPECAAELARLASETESDEQRIHLPRQAASFTALLGETGMDPAQIMRAASTSSSPTVTCSG